MNAVPTLVCPECKKAVEELTGAQICPDCEQARNGNGPAAPTPPDGTATVHTPTADRDAAWATCADLARHPRILERFAAELPRIGLVGEDRLGQLVYLATTSRLLQEPVSVAIKGPSSGGKSFAIERTLDFFPAEATYKLTGMSERAFAYSEEPLAHRTLVIFEAVGMEGDFASYLIRSLLSEGCVRYETVDRTKAGLKGRLVERQGPTGLIVTTTRVRLHPENETRLISMVVNDTPAQTKAVMLALAEEEEATIDLGPWQALQRWLEPAQVSVPYAKALAGLVPPVAVRLRRDFGAVLGLIRAHALLHQATRKRDDQDRLVATFNDYAVVRGLVADLVSEGVGATVRPVIRETVAAVDDLEPDHEAGVPQAALAKRLKLDRSAVSRRVQTAITEGYLRNLEERKGRAYRLVLGDPLLENVEILPDPDVLMGVCTVARRPGGVKATPTGAEGATAEFPQGCPSHPDEPDLAGCRYCRFEQRRAAREAGREAAG